MDLLFAADTPWVWDAEKTFARLKAENPGYVETAARKNSLLDEEAAKSVTLEQRENAA